ncbi:hypothetical protein [Desulfovibrio cuneatus]|uniref:hypothetical protein n=1 Tax=Desulfovibrio cuneatus TaxID=159728 RepID=UPI00048870EC|nr:hypothetical protein [Desulfovibrio cuneatus]
MSNTIKWGLVLLCLGAVCLGAYQLGYGKAEAEGLAALRLVQVQQEEERRAAAEAYGAALANTLARYQQEVMAAEQTAHALSVKNNALESQAQTLRREIKHATAGSVHIFSAEFVRLWNGFTGAVTSAPRALPAPGSAGSVAGTGTAGASAGTGIPGVNPAGSGAPRGGESSRGAGQRAMVTEEDVLEYMAYYGSRCQRLEAKEHAWRELAKGWRE